MAPKSPRRRVSFTGRQITDLAYRGLRGVIDYAQKVGGWQIVGLNTGPFVPYDQLDLSSVDGVLGYLQDWPWANALHRAGKPAVNLSNLFPEMDFPRVASDDMGVGRLGARHLLERGFASLGFCGLFQEGFTRMRYEGFGQLTQEDTGRRCDVLDVDLADPNARQKINQWLLALPKPVGVMAANDLVGRQIIDNALQLGLRVPGDVAVLGVDNERWLTQLSSVPMSSIELDARQIGYRAAKLLDDLMNGRPPTPTQWIPPTGVVTRRSTDIIVAEDPVVAKALRMIRDRCGAGIKVDDLLDELDVSRRTLELRLRRAIGQTPQEAIYRAQIERAKKLLASQATMREIANACGFDHEQRLYLVFKRETGMTPGQYRRRFGSATE